MNRTMILAALAAASVGCARSPSIRTEAPVVMTAPPPTTTLRSDSQATALDARKHHGELALRRGITLAGARAAIAGAVTEAKRRHAGGVVAVVDEGGNLVALERLDGTFAAGAHVSIGKARTSVLFKKPTKFFEDVIKGGRTPMIALEDFTPLQGGVPIIVDGEVIGGVGVSGASSAAEDEQLAMAGAAAVGTALEGPEASRSTQAEPPGMPVRFDRDEVARAFLVGKPLVEQSDLKVHASRREGPGRVEVHAADTDVMYVLEGTATIVTGGTVVDPVTVEPGEVRGASIQGGTQHRVGKGDVFIIPRGVPHWFKEVSGPMTYYTVKAPRRGSP